MNGIHSWIFAVRTVFLYTPVTPSSSENDILVFFAVRFFLYTSEAMDLFTPEVALFFIFFKISFGGGG